MSETHVLTSGDEAATQQAAATITEKPATDTAGSLMDRLAAVEGKVAAQGKCDLVELRADVDMLIRRIFGTHPVVKAPPPPQPDQPQQQ